MFGKPEKLTKSVQKLANLEQVFDITIDRTSGDHAIIECPFCGRPDVLFINTTNLLWDCKVCDKKGNWEGFLTNLHKDYLTVTPESALARLANYRRLPIQAIRKYKIAFSKGRYWIPIFNQNHRVVNFKHFRAEERPIGLKAHDSGIFNYQVLVNTKKSPVYICEGEFDCMALDWLLTANEREVVVVGIPGY